MTKLMKKFGRNESGATAIEYGLIAGLIAVVLIAGAVTVGDNILAQFNKIGSELAVTPE